MAEIAAALGRGSARREIARLVLSRGQMSKAEIEAALDYSHPTVINTVGALVADGANGEPQFHVKGEGLGLRLAVKAVRTGYAGWGTMMADASARAEDPPPSPVPAAAVQGKAETIELAPIALTQLRITLFPWIK